MAKNGWAGKNKTLIAIRTASHLTLDCVDQTASMLDFIACYQGGKVGIDETVAELLGTNRDNLRATRILDGINVAWESVGEVEEWLTRSHTQQAMSPHEDCLLPPNQMGRRYSNVHYFILHQCNLIAGPMGSCCESIIRDNMPPFDALTALVKELVLVTCRQARLDQYVHFPIDTNELQDLREQVCIEMYLANEIWENSPRSDSEERVATPHTSKSPRRPGRPSNPKRDNEIADAVASGLYTNEQIGEMFDISGSAVTKAKERARGAKFEHDSTA